MIIANYNDKIKIVCGNFISYCALYRRGRTIWRYSIFFYLLLLFFNELEVFLNCILCRLSLKLPWGICSQCFKLINFPLSSCLVCGLPLFYNDKTCYHCVKFKPNWQRLTAFSAYQYPFTKLIHQFKSNNKTALSYALARLIFLAWYQHRLSTGLIKPDIVTCVPLHKSRYWSRGYNQSALLAKPIARWLGADFQPFLVKRNFRRTDQKLLSKQQRAVNVNQLFSCDYDLTGKTIAVIDDIVTTGHTVNELSKRLKRQGALHIQVLCLCRTNL